MIQIVLTQVQRQETTHEGGLSTTLSSDERWYALVSMQHIHLKPVGHRRAQPDCEIVQLLGSDAWNASEDFGYVVLSIPLRQSFEECLHRIVLRNLFRLHVLRNFRLRTSLLQNLFALGTNDDAVEGRRRQRTVLQICLIRGARETVELVDSVAFSLVVSLWQNRKLNLPIEDVSTETVVRHEELLDDKRSFLRGSWSLCRQKITLHHSYI